MKKLNTALALTLSATLLFGAVIPANAASAEVTIEVKETLMEDVSVIVPTSIPIIFNEDGTNTLPTNWTIQNISTIAGIHLAQIDMDGTEKDWKLLRVTEDSKTMRVDKKAIKFSVGKDDVLQVVNPVEGTENHKGRITYEPGEMSIASGTTQVLDFGVERGAFTETKAADKAFDMVLTFEFN